MAANFPTSSPSFTNPSGTDYLNSPAHATQHSGVNDEVVAIAAKIGTGSSTPTDGKYLKGNGTGTSAWTALTINRAFTWYLDGTSINGVAGATYICPQAMTVTQTQAKLTSGTCTATLKKGATTINAISCTSTLATDTTITSAALTKGDLITLTISSASSPVGLIVTMECTQP